MSVGAIFFSGGFRPFFFGAGLYAGLSVVVWVAALQAPQLLPERIAPVLWHVHEMLFGYLAAVVAGFLLTAVPNWTNRPPVTGARLAALFTVWLAGRGLSLLPVSLGTAAVDVLFLILVAAYLWTQVIASGNRRNIVVAALISAFALGHVLWYAERLNGAYSSLPAGMGQRLGIATLVCLLCLIGGRLVPNFSSNWLAQRGGSDLPTAPDRFDVICIVVIVVTMLGWTIAPHSQIVGLMLIAAGALHLGRISRWRGLHTRSEPLVFVLHVAYAWLPLGFLLLGSEILAPAYFARGAGLHALTAGAAGTMTMAVMTRATLGHSGRPLAADRITVAIYLLVLSGAVGRVVAPYVVFLSPAQPYLLHTLAGCLWACGFGLFSVAYSRYFFAPGTTL